MMGNWKDCGNRESGIVLACLGSILLLTLLLRLYGIDWGLPSPDHPHYSYHPDEAPLLIWAQWLSQGQLVTKQFIYGGTFYFVILRACIYFGDLLREYIGGFNALANAILVARYFQVFLALLSVLLVYECGRMLYDRKTGLVAALILAVAPAHIVVTQTVRPDAISTFLAILITLMAVKILRSERPDQRKLLVYTGIAIGATAAFRLPMIAFSIMPAIAYVIARQRACGGPFWEMIFDWNMLWLSLAIIGTYVVLSPHPLMYPEVFMEGIRTTMMYETRIYPDAMDRGPIFYQYGSRLLYQALGYPAYFLAVGGMTYTLIRHRIEDVIILTGVGLYFLMLASVTLTFVRYTLPVLPLLALLSGIAVIRIFEQARHARMLLFIIMGVFLAWTLAADIAFLRVTASKNVRIHASEWIAQNISQGKSVLLVKQYEGDDFFNPIISSQHNLMVVLLTDGSKPRRIFTEVKIDNVILHELFYRDMERLGSRHPRNEVKEFNESMTSSGLKLLKEFKLPLKFLGMDFSGSFEAIDYLVINPGIRIYQSP